MNPQTTGLADKGNEIGAGGGSPARNRRATVVRQFRKALRLAAQQEPESAPPEIFEFLDVGDAYDRISGIDQKEFEKGLAAYCAPYLRSAALELAGIGCDGSAAALPGIEDVLKHALAGLRRRLNEASQQSATLLQNVARIRGELHGDTPEARAMFFSERLLDRGYRETCRAQFPLLDQILARMTEDAVACWGEFFDRLADNSGALSALVPGGLGRLCELQFYAGDAHNGGRSVVVVRGGNGSVVYKPRPLDTDAVLSTALGWMGGKIGLGLEHVALLQRPEYGWTAFIAGAECVDETEVGLCYERCGVLLALMFVLGGADIHHENIICRGAQPYIIDAEALLNGPLNGPTPFARGMQRTRLETLFNMSYLPAVTVQGDSKIDISGMGYRAGQELEFKDAIMNDGRDDLAAKLVTTPSKPFSNIPYLRGEAQDIEPYLGHFTRGFRRALETVMTHRAEFLNAPDLLPSFAAARFRYIARPTAHYGKVLRQSMHPHACATPEKRNNVIAALAPQNYWCDRVCVDILASEYLALRRGDIPLFNGRATRAASGRRRGGRSPTSCRKPATGRSSAAFAGWTRGSSMCRWLRSSCRSAPAISSPAPRRDGAPPPGPRHRAPIFGSKRPKRSATGSFAARSSREDISAGQAGW